MKRNLLSRSITRNITNEEREKQNREYKTNDDHNIDYCPINTNYSSEKHQKIQKLQEIKYGLYDRIKQLEEEIEYIKND